MLNENDMKQKADYIKRLYSEGTVGIVKAGMEAAAVKVEILGTSPTSEHYREWRMFYQKYLGWPMGQVNRSVDVGTAFGEHLDLVCKMDISALYILARATEEIRSAALEKAKNGDFVAHKDAQEMIGQGKGNKKKPKLYKIIVPQGTVVVTASQRRLADVRAALVAALELIEAKIAKKTK